MVPPKIKGKEGQSRNGTPLSVEIPDSSDGGPSTSPMSTANISYGDILDQYCRGSSPPASATLKRIADALKICSDVAKDRSDFCDKAMRETLRRKQELVEVVREQELEEKRIAEEQQDQLRQAALKHQQESARPPAVGAHSLARQDGKDSTGMAIHMLSFCLGRNVLSPFCFSSAYSHANCRDINRTLTFLSSFPPLPTVALILGCGHRWCHCLHFTCVHFLVLNTFNLTVDWAAFTCPLIVQIISL